ncbi:glycosyltransferase family 2 protein [Variovorax ureilyticus]|uniref:glycosyltransferase family 2 protein n=1 Tax=Variovorax ureilyticus TaxID=1836198 RepID=UPI003D66C187
MNQAPLLSYIVLSYNYDRYIEKTLRSILSQTIQDFEIIVVDDASSDRSVAVVEAINDQRIRLYVNEKNMGGAASYNRAVTEARGEWLVNLDADDWIDPLKAEKQLQAVAQDPTLDIIGSYIAVRDENDSVLPAGQSHEEAMNKPHALNLVDTWIGANYLCRSSTMVRAAAHRRIGLDDPTMVRAPDYELWTRALREGCRFALVPEQLTFMRMHSQGVTHAHPIGTLMEMSYAMQRNLAPLAEERSLNLSFTRMVAWVAKHPSFEGLPRGSAHRLIGALMAPTSANGFTSFMSLINDATDHDKLAAIGRRTLAFLGPRIDEYQEVGKLLEDVEAYRSAVDHFKTQSESWEREYRYLESKVKNTRPSAQPS